MKVTLTGGPFHGAEVESDGRSPVIAKGDPVPEGMVARYRPTHERGVFAFREYDRIIGTVPGPGAAA